MNFVKFSFVFCLLYVTLTSARPSSNENALEGKRLIKTSAEHPGEWLSEEKIFGLIRKKIHFMDITDSAYRTEADAPTITALPSTIRYQSEVRSILPKLDVSRIEKFIVDFSSFPNRYYNNNNGVEAAEWIVSRVTEAIVQSGYKGNGSVKPFSHSWLMDSVVARIEGSDPTLKSEVVILGAHMDSINGGNPVNGAAPGADDNASGSAVLLEAFRAILESGFIPKRSLEFQWYSAEEVGLRGSGDIAKAYINGGVNVISMLNFDVVGYYTEGRNEISFLTDYTDKNLTDLLKLAVEEYLTVGWVNEVCGYGCSDHASWDSYKIPAASPDEPVVNPYMHTVRDTIDRVSFTQVLEFARLAVAYAVEIAEPSN